MEELTQRLAEDLGSVGRTQLDILVSIPDPPFFQSGDLEIDLISLYLV